MEFIGLISCYKFKVVMEDPSKYFRVLIKFMDEQFVDSFVNWSYLFLNCFF